MNALPYALPGDRRRAKLDAVQARIDQLLIERRTLEAAPVSDAEFRTRVAGQLQAWPSTLATRAGSQTVRSVRVGLGVNEPLTLSDLAWLFGRDVIIDRLEAGVSDYLSSQPSRLTGQAFEASLGKNSSALSQLLQEEEAEVLALFDAGVKAVRREGADVQVTLAAWQNEG